MPNYLKPCKRVVHYGKDLKAMDTIRRAALLLEQDLTPKDNSLKRLIDRLRYYEKRGTRDVRRFATDLLNLLD